MTNGIYINQRNIREFGAKLQTDYTIGGGKVENITNCGVNRSSERLLRQARGPLEIVLPLDIYGRTKRETMDRLAGLMAQLTGTFELNLSDGYAYTCILQDVGDTAWIGDEICSVDITLQGFKHRSPICASGALPLTIYNPGTWPRTDCKLTIKSFPVTGKTVVITMENAAGVYLRWTLDTSGSIYTGGDLVLDGQAMCNRYNGGALQAGTLEWTDFPYLLPGENTVSITGGSGETQAEVEFTPTYL